MLKQFCICDIPQCIVRPWKRRRAGALVLVAVMGVGVARLGRSQSTDTATTASQSIPPTYSVLYSFTGGSDGGYPYSPVIEDSAGNFYGTTVGGGTSNPDNCSYYGQSGCGVVFKLDTAGNQTVLYSFTGEADGAAPSFGGLLRDNAGNLYGATTAGGTAGICGGIGGGPCGNGVLFKLDTAGNETVLHVFTYAEGVWPNAGLIQDSAGNLYGGSPDVPAVPEPFGPYQYGGVFKLDTVGNLTVLHTFSDDPVADGANPSLIRDSAGNLYGTARKPDGKVFKLDAAGNYSVLHNFTGGADGRLPSAGLIRDEAGRLYGTTTIGGIYNAGVVFKLSPEGEETVLYSFTGGADGGFPSAGLIWDRAGNIYGTTSAGGANTSNCSINGQTGCGVVFKLDRAGKETVLHTFTGGAEGGGPNAALMMDSSGNLYGTTVNGGDHNFGVVFKLTLRAERQGTEDHHDRSST